MTAKANKVQTFTVRHESGETWKIACNSARGKEHMNKLAHQFMQNGMAKRRIRGEAIATNDESGETVVAINHAPE